MTTEIPSEEFSTGLFADTDFTTPPDPVIRSVKTNLVTIGAETSVEPEKPSPPSVHSESVTVAQNSTGAQKKTTVKKKTTRTTPLSRHLSGECGCSMEVNPNSCAYQIFRDGWSFTPDVGNGQVRGEIFTPRFIVDKMITDAHIFPSEAVYDGDYTCPDALARIRSTVLEPAVGTGNFITTIVYHKMRYAAVVAQDINEYTDLILDAVGSVYAYDIDAGNLEVTTRRLLGSDDDLTSDIVRDAWVNKVIALNSKADSSAVQQMVLSSLEAARTHWSDHLGEGLIPRMYRDHTGEEMSDDLRARLITVASHNILLFNGIVRDNTDTIPGYVNVVWYRWSVGEKVSASSMNNTMVDTQIQNIHKRLSDSDIDTKTRKSLTKDIAALESNKVDLDLTV